MIDFEDWPLDKCIEALDEIRTRAVVGASQIGSAGGSSATFFPRHDEEKTFRALRNRIADLLGFPREYADGVHVYVVR